MLTQSEKAAAFKALHIKGKPLILYNIWDAGSAKIVEESGAPAVATGSYSVAMAHGYGDGEKLPLERALLNLETIVAATLLPVSLDFEGAYGISPEAVAATTRKAIAAGAIGFNFEDQIIGSDALYSIDDQCARISAMRVAAYDAGIDIFINARTDIFLKSPSTDHTAKLDAALERAQAYAKAGASGFFAPGLADADLIAALCAQCPLPVNIMMMNDMPALAELGVSRISHGPQPYRMVMQALAKEANAVYQKSE